MGPTDRNLMTVEVEQYIVYVKQAAPHANAHDTARDGERYCIRKVTKQRLMNDRHGGAGRHPDDKSVGGVFLLAGIKWP